MEGVAFAYDDRARIFSDLNLEVASGVTLLSGENGAGKTTLLKLAAGVERPDAGRVLVNGSDLWRREVAARSDLAFVPQEPDVTPFATIREVLRLVCRLRSQPAQQVDQMLDETDLEDSADLSIRELSRGQRRRVLLAAAWIGTPRTAILDEPTTPTRTASGRGRRAPRSRSSRRPRTTARAIGSTGATEPWTWRDTTGGSSSGCAERTPGCKRHVEEL